MVNYEGEIQSEPLDMRLLLGLSRLDDYTDIDYWTGEEEGEDEISHSFPKESPVGDIFISEYDQLHEHCLVELNFNELDGKTIKDTNGTGNKGILFGDYSIRKNTKEMPLVRQTTIDYPEVETEDGAL